MIDEHIQDARDIAVMPLALSESHNGSKLKSDTVLQQLDEVTLAAAKSARDYRSWMLENVKVDIGAAPADANVILSSHVAPDIARRPGDQSREQEINSDTPNPNRQLPAPSEAFDDYRAKAVELINASVNASLDYAQRLAGLRSPAEFIALSTDNACRYLELIMTHTAAVGALSQSFATIKRTRGMTPTSRKC
jgi:Phasin protein